MDFTVIRVSLVDQGLDDREPRVLFLGRPFFFLSAHQLQTPCSRVLLEKLTGPQLVKKFPAFYESQRFITEF